MFRSIFFKQFSTMTPFVLNGKKEWTTQIGKIIYKDIIIVKNMGNFHTQEKQLQFYCNTLILQDCNKEFVAEWLRPHMFPTVKIIYLLSHPCDSDLFERWYYSLLKPPTIYLSNNYSQYKLGWANYMENVKILNVDELNLIKKFYFPHIK